MLEEQEFLLPDPQGIVSDCRARGILSYPWCDDLRCHSVVVWHHNNKGQTGHHGGFAGRITIYNHLDRDGPNVLMVECEDLDVEPAVSTLPGRQQEGEDL